MSALNGDKSRYQIQRKARLLRRTRSRLALAAMRAQAASVQADSGGAVAAGGRPQPGGTRPGRARPGPASAKKTKSREA